LVTVKISFGIWLDCAGYLYQLIEEKHNIEKNIQLYHTFVSVWLSMHLYTKQTAQLRGRIAVRGHLMWPDDWLTSPFLNEILINLLHTYPKCSNDYPSAGGYLSCNGILALSSLNHDATVPATLSYGRLCQENSRYRWHTQQGQRKHTHVLTHKNTDTNTHKLQLNKVNACTVTHTQGYVFTP